MMAASTRTLKEARALLYPWLAVMLFSTVPLLGRRDPAMAFLFQVGVLLGIPLIACLSFGNEFRHKTMDLLATQPVNRLKIWREKWSVVVFAALTAGLVAGLVSPTPLRLTRAADLDFVMFLIVTTCSAPFWTLLGRSTLGGLVLNIASFIPLISIKTSLWMWNSTSGLVTDTSAILILSAAVVGYSAVMLWLGRRMLVHRQSGEGLAGPDITNFIPALMPARIASWFRCRSDQRILNLIRNELRMLRPLWLFMALYVAGWTAMAISFSLVPSSGGRQQTLLVILVGLTATYPVIAMFLAASLSMGEEGPFGVQLWHLTLPLSIRTQWLTRLLSALVAGIVTAVAIPAMLMALAQATLPPGYLAKLDSMTLIEPVPALLAFFFVTFWCASVARDLTRIAGLMVAVGIMLGVAGITGVWIAERLIESVEFLQISIVAWFQLNPESLKLRNFLGWFPNLARTPQGILMTALCVPMTIQTYSLFRRLRQNSNFTMIRSLVPYLALTLIFTSSMTLRTWNGGWAPAYELLRETQHAVAKLQPTDAFTVEDLSRTSALPTRTRHWLRDSRMSVTFRDYPARPWMPAGGDWKWYDLTVRLASGTTCTTSFAFHRIRSADLLSFSGTCR